LAEVDYDQRVMGNRTPRQPGVVIVCESGGVDRAFNESGGFLASGGPCVLHDEHGGHTSADAISVYDDAMSSP